MTKIQKFTVGDRVVRIQGRPASIGMSGTVTHVFHDGIGTGGDILVAVLTADGETFQCYDRQLAPA